MRTSLACGAATTTSTSASGCFGAKATAALQVMGLPAVSAMLCAEAVTDDVFFFWLWCSSHCFLQPLKGGCLYRPVHGVTPHVLRGRKASGGGSNEKRQQVLFPGVAIPRCHSARVAVTRVAVRRELSARW